MLKLLSKAGTHFNLNLLDLMEFANLKNEDHPSLNATRDNCSKLDNSLYQTLKVLVKINPKKASQMNDIHIKLLK